MIISNLGSRATVDAMLASLKDRNPFLDVTGALVAQGAVDQICKVLIEKHVDMVTFFNASDKFRSDFLKAHRLRSAKFIVNFKNKV